ncbi:MAG TPA: protein kinase [Candidatus Acidoferrum sp.]|nr:protein kinase [Candidatus Acidoferrum sp.]
MPAELVSHYRILGPLGSGGMGAVYRAEDTTLHRTVALKFLPESVAHAEKVHERLKREARSASALNHPNICTIYEVGDDAGEMFIAMEYIEGRTLSELIRQGPLPLEKVLRYSSQIASALAHAHERGIIHGDLKPPNIIVTPGGEAKILDFGLARRSDPLEFDRKTLEVVSADGDVSMGGTFPYMAPEQIEGGDASPRTDIWSFGIVLYEMIGGTRPFQGASHFLLCNSILRDPPRPLPPTVPAGLKTVVSRCLEKEPERRYRRAGEARAALEAAGLSTDQVVLPSQAAHRFQSRSALIALAFIVLAAVGILAIRNNRPHLPAISLDPMPSRVLLGVLPPSDSGDPAQSAFDTGLVDTLNSRLGELGSQHSLSVIPMNSTIEKRVTTIDGAREQFGVNLVLVLNIQRASGNVRVNYALMDARSHLQVRSGTITASLADPFALQDQVFEKVAASLELQLGPEEERSLASHGTTEPAAFDFYTQGRGYLQDYVVPEKVENAITLFRRALEKDPNYAAATAGLGEAYWRKFQLTHDHQWDDAAVSTCQKATQLGPNLALARSCLGRALSSQGSYEKAVEQYRRALELDPGSDDAYGGLAAAYEKLGRLDEAEMLYKQAITVRPAYWATYNWLGLFYMAHARYDEAATMFSQVTSLVPDSFIGFYNLGGVRVLQGKYGEAVPLLEQSLKIRPTANALSNLGTAYFQMRQYAESAADFERAVKLDGKNYELWGNLGDAYYWTPGRREEAAGAYSTAISLGEENLRHNPRDAQLRAYLGQYHAMRGERKPALDEIAAALRLQPNSPDVQLVSAIVYQQLGDSGRTLNALEKAVSLGIAPETIRDTPNFGALRGNPRFLVLIHGSHPSRTN